MNNSNEHGGRSCREMFERLSEYLDGELPDDFCRRIESHMDDCEPCQVFLDSLRRTVGLVGDLQPDDLPEEFREQLRAAASKLYGGSEKKN